MYLNIDRFADINSYNSFHIGYFLHLYKYYFLFLYIIENLTSMAQQTRLLVILKHSQDFLTWFILKGAPRNFPFDF